MRHWPTARLDWLVGERRDAVDVSNIGSDTAFYYSIPALDAYGDGIIEPVVDIGSNKLLLCGEEILVSKLNPRISRVLVAQKHDEPTIASTEFIALVPSADIETQFLCYWLESEPTRQLLDGATLSVTRSQQRVRADVLTKARINVPPLNEQRAIITHLDVETARIDTLIEKKQRIVQLLNEQFQQQVRTNVTGSMEFADPLNVHPTEISKPHWAPVKLGTDLVFGSGTTPPAGHEQYYGGDTPWILTGNLRDQPVEQVTGSVTSEAISKFSALQVHPSGALIVAMYGATVGRLGITTYPTTVNQACCVIHSGTRINTMFLFYYLLAHRAVIVDRSLGAGQPNISQEILKSLRLPIPDSHEQEKIVNRLDARRAQSDQLIARIEVQLASIREYRQALITAAVMGELDIPGLAI